jgi:hypothetical protein
MHPKRIIPALLLAALSASACATEEEADVEVVDEVGTELEPRNDPGMVTGTTGAPGPGTTGTPGVPAAPLPDTIE